MTNLIKLEGGKPVGNPVTGENFRQLFPSTSFPARLSAEAVESFGYGIYDFSNKPDATWSQKVVEVAPVRNAAGVWRQTWSVVQLAGEELAQAEAEKNRRLIDDIVLQTQQRLDAFARTRNYDGILSLCTYATSAVPKFQGEAQYGVVARDSTWAKLYSILADVEAGTHPVPSSFAEIENQLPVLAWPN